MIYCTDVGPASTTILTVGFVVNVVSHKLVTEPELLPRPATLKSLYVLGLSSVLKDIFSFSFFVLPGTS